MERIKALLNRALSDAGGSSRRLAELRMVLQEAIAKVNALEYQASQREWNEKNLNRNMGGQ